MVNIQGNDYPGYGRCIYCGSDGGNAGLRDEHVIPFSLGGNTRILAASCQACEAVTSYIDGYLARHIFYDYRLRTGIQTRRPKARPRTKPTDFQFEDGERTLDIPVADRPHSLVMPVWGSPGLLRGVPPSPRFPTYTGHGYGFIPADMRRTLGLRPGEKYKVNTSGTISFHTFARAMVKIAYCHAIISFGLGNFRQLVMPDMILGKYYCLPYFVGADLGDPPPPLEGHLHHVTCNDLSFGQLKLLLIRVRLFANSGTQERGLPIYDVLTGPRRDRSASIINPLS